MVVERYLNQTEWLAVRFQAVKSSVYLTETSHVVKRLMCSQKENMNRLLPDLLFEMIFLQCIEFQCFFKLCLDKFYHFEHNLDIMTHILSTKFSSLNLPLQYDCDIVTTTLVDPQNVMLWR